MSKFLGLATVVCTVQTQYYHLVAEGQEQAVKQIETMVGAGIWYLPSTNKMKLLWTGYKSEEAIALNEESEEHIYPRKLSAKKLLNIVWSEIDNPEQYIKNLYYNELGKFHIVSKKENKRLVSFQREGVFVDWQTAYQQAGIKLIKVTD
jgi:hypothetical protein